MLQDGDAIRGDVTTQGRENDGVGGVPFQRRGGRPFSEWIFAWLGREFLAFPIWAWAFFGGVSVVWRGRSFRVGVDMRVREIGDVTRAKDI